jgi:hypothetical protein
MNPDEEKTSPPFESPFAAFHFRFLAQKQGGSKSSKAKSLKVEAFP